MCLSRGGIRTRLAFLGDPLAAEHRLGEGEEEERKVGVEGRGAPVYL